MRVVYVVNGYPGSGKTLFGSLVSKKLEETNFSFLHASSIDPIKEILLPRDMWGSYLEDSEENALLEELKREITKRDWDGETKDVYWRGVMSDLKLAVIKHDEDLIDSMIISQLLSQKAPSLSFVDIRETINIERFLNKINGSKDFSDSGAIFIRSDVNDEFDNHSDGDVENYKYNYTVDNSRRRWSQQGLDPEIQLQDQAEKFLRKIQLISL